MTKKRDDILFCLKGGRNGKGGSKEKREKRRNLDKRELAAQLRRQLDMKCYQQNLRSEKISSC